MEALPGVQERARVLDGDLPAVVQLVEEFASEPGVDPDQRCPHGLVRPRMDRHACLALEHAVPAESGCRVPRTPLGQSSTFDMLRIDPAMRVLFAYPNLYTQMGFNHGLASLSACLKRDGHE